MKSIAALVSAAALAFLSGCVYSHTETRTSAGMVSFKVDGMACPNCAKHIEEDLSKLPGVKSAKVDFASKKATVTVADQNPATLEQMNAAVEAWKKEHFAQESDPECLDPKKREEIKANSAK
jgi:copper chaperone CopZ